MHLHGVETVVEEVQFTSTAGYRLHGHVHRPARTGPHPSVLLVPGIDDPGTVFDGWGQPVAAEELARMGLVVLHFDPAGRGDSWGTEDFGGPEHQDDLLVALRALLARKDVVPARSGVLSISLGVSMAVGALARAGDRLPISWFIDWEGPSDREVITAGGRILTPAAGHGLDDDGYWVPREAVRHVGRLSCGYFRYQGAEDHAQPGEHRHALRMVRAASCGSLPWFQLNDHPRGVVPEEPEWFPPGHSNRILKRKILEFVGG